MTSALVRLWLALIALGAFLVTARGQFQQRVDHVIEVRLDDTAHVLHAFQSITYHNRSPVPLDTIWIHLWPNAYRDRSSALCKQLVRGGDLSLHFAKPERRGAIDSLDFRVDGRTTTWGAHTQHADIAWVALTEPVEPGSSVVITTPFRVRLPDARYSRLGHVGQAYGITQWYPKPAVYDHLGWHIMPYLDLGEFFNEFGSYDVRIDVPTNYVVAATGALQDEGERTWLDSLASITPDPSSWPQDKKGRIANTPPPSSDQRKVLHFVQDSVHDFAWFADKRFLVERSSTRIPGTERHVATWAFILPRNYELWKDSAVTYTGRALRAYSERVGPYPYHACTVVDGGPATDGGMEYPMITVIGNSSDHEGLDNVITHEVGHNWFQGMLASNEREHAWMDEGMNSYVELLYMRRYYPDSRIDVGIPFLAELLADRQDPHHLLNELGYRLNARRNLDQAVERPSQDFTEINYGTMLYMKSALIFDHLGAYLGQALMDSCLQAYFEAYRSKHPSPADVRRTFEEVSGKDLSWVFDMALASDRKFDVKARRDKDGALLYASRSPVPVPFPVTGIKGKDTLGTVWCEGSAGKASFRTPWPEASGMVIDANARTLDIDRRNNTTPGAGPFGTKPSIGLIPRPEKDFRRSVYLAPALAYNAHDGFMAGPVLHNISFPAQRWDLAIAPVYGTGSGRVVGGGSIRFHHDRVRSAWLGNLHAGLSVMSASLDPGDAAGRYYRKAVPSVDLDVRCDPGVRKSTHQVGYRAVFLQEVVERDVVDQAPERTQRDDLFHQLRYTTRQRSGLAPFSTELIATHHEAFTRAELVSEHAFMYDRRKHRISLRLFAGLMLRTDPELMRREFAWRLHWGANDMLYDHLFVNRQDLGTLTDQQFAEYQGGFKTPNSFGTSDTWLASVNAEADLPIPLPLSLFVSGAVAPVTEAMSGGSRTVPRSYFEAGVGLRIVRDMFEIWFPLVFSQDIADQLEFRGIGPGERVRFILALEALDPFKLLRNMKP